MKEYVKPELIVEETDLDNIILTSVTLGIFEDDDNWTDQDKFGE